jgi:hypothetical protein
MMVVKVVVIRPTLPFCPKDDGGEGGSYWGCSPLLACFFFFHQCFFFFFSQTILPEFVSLFIVV